MTWTRWTTQRWRPNPTSRTSFNQWLSPVRLRWHPFSGLSDTLQLQPAIFLSIDLSECVISSILKIPYWQGLIFSLDDQPYKNVSSEYVNLARKEVRGAFPDMLNTCPCVWCYIWFAYMCTCCLQTCVVRVKGGRGGRNSGALLFRPLFLISPGSHFFLCFSRDWMTKLDFVSVCHNLINFSSAIYVTSIPFCLVLQ